MKHVWDLETKLVDLIMLKSRDENTPRLVQDTKSESRISGDDSGSLGK